MPYDRCVPAIPEHGLTAESLAATGEGTFREL